MIVHILLRSSKSYFLGDDNATVLMQATGMQREPMGVQSVRSGRHKTNVVAVGSKAVSRQLEYEARAKSKLCPASRGSNGH